MIRSIMEHQRLVYLSFTNVWVTRELVSEFSLMIWAASCLCGGGCRRSLVAQETDGGFRARIQKPVNLWQQLETESSHQSGSCCALRRTSRPLCACRGLCFPTGLPSARSCSCHSHICCSVLQPRRRQNHVCARSVSVQRATTIPFLRA